jgi:phage tail-like protein
VVAFSVNVRRFDPYKNYRFRVKLDGRYVAGVSKMSPLPQLSGPLDCRQGHIVRQHAAIILEHGVTHDIEFENWLRKSSSNISFNDIKRNLILEVFNEAGRLAAAFKVYGCWVSEFQALPELDANANAIAIQTVKLENDGWERDSSTTEPTEPNP